MSRARRQQYMLRTEASEQEAVITICKFMENRYPELKLLHHCPNGGKRDRVSAAVLKRQGVKAGVPDLHLPVPKGQYASLYIEMKYGDGRLQWQKWSKKMVKTIKLIGGTRLSRQHRRSNVCRRIYRKSYRKRIQGSSGKGTKTGN